MVHNYFVKTAFEMSHEGETRYFAFIPGSEDFNKTTARAVLNCDGDCTATIYEGGTISMNGGTPIAIECCNRCDVCDAKMQVYADPEVLVAGTAFWSARTFAASPSVAVSKQTNYDIVPCGGVVYIWEITHNDKHTCTVDVDFFWEENVKGHSEEHDRDEHRGP